MALEKNRLNEPLGEQAKDRIYKSIPAFITKIDSNSGQVEAIVSVFGVTDMMDDVIHPGAYAKTLTERVGQIRVLDNHRSDSALAAVGFPIAMKEIGRDELPDSVLKKFPEATGGLWTLSQFLLETPEGKGIFQRIQAGALNEWSIGFDALDTDLSRIAGKDGKMRVVRNIRTIRLWEYSVVLWGANQATATIEARNNSVSSGGKDKTMPQQSKSEKDAPNYRQQVAGGHDRCSNCLFYQAMDGTKGTCSKYAFQAADDYVCDGYDPSNQKNTPERREWTPEGPEKRFGDTLKSRTYDAYIACVNANYSDGLLDSNEHMALAENGIAILKQIDAGMSEDVANRPIIDLICMDMMFWAAEGPRHLRNLQAQAVKAGRVLSKRNSDRLLKAVEELTSVLTDAGLYDETPAEDTSAEKGAADEPQPNPAEPTEVRAGSSDQTPTLEELAQLKQSLSEIK